MRKAKQLTRFVKRSMRHPTTMHRNDKGSQRDYVQISELPDRSLQLDAGAKIGQACALPDSNPRLTLYCSILAAFHLIRSFIK
jgi:hypothetical protein